MRLALRVTRLSLALSAVALLAACGTTSKLFPDRGPDYKSSRTAPTLEVPPDLTSSTVDDTMVVPDITPASTASYSDYTRERGGTGTTLRSAAVLPEQDSVKMMRDGRAHWLVVQGTPDQVWNKVREYWLQSGFLLKVDDPRIGVMETDWAENRADIPQGPIRRVIGKVFDSAYSAATRDKYRVRLEPGAEPGTTEVYLVHYGAEEVDTQGGDNTAWRPRPSDPELEVEMLRRITVYLGVEGEKAKAMAAKPETAPALARLEHDSAGHARLIINEDFSRAWRRTGLALDRVGFTVEDRDRSQGVYYVRYNDPAQGEKKSWLSKLAFWSDGKPDQNQYQVKLSAQGATTEVVVTDMEGKQNSTETAGRILVLLEEQLK